MDKTQVTSREVVRQRQDEDQPANGAGSAKRQRRVGVASKDAAKGRLPVVAQEEDRYLVVRAGQQAPINLVRDVSPRQAFAGRLQAAMNAMHSGNLMLGAGPAAARDKGWTLPSGPGLLHALNPVTGLLAMALRGASGGPLLRPTDDREYSDRIYEITSRPFDGRNWHASETEAVARLRLEHAAGTRNNRAKLEVFDSVGGPSYLRPLSEDQIRRLVEVLDACMGDYLQIDRDVRMVPGWTPI